MAVLTGAKDLADAARDRRVCRSCAAGAPVRAWRARLRPTRGRARAAGFTLIELLVSVFVLAVLIAILVPALNRARISARTTACLTRLRELGRGWQMYADGHGDTLSDRALGYRKHEDGLYVDLDPTDDQPHNRLFSGSGRDTDPPPRPH